MSRSKIKDKFIQKKYKDGKVDYYKSTQRDSYKNKHRLDEMPKNKPSKFVQFKCKCVDWLQESVNFGGHKPKKGGHRMVSGIVRAKTKEEINKSIEEQINELNFDDIKIIPEKE